MISATTEVGRGATFTDWEATPDHGGRYELIGGTLWRACARRPHTSVGSAVCCVDDPFRPPG